MDDSDRGREIAERQDALGLSDRDLAKRADVYRDRVPLARDGRVSEKTFRKIEQALEDAESERESGAIVAGEATGEDVDTSQFIEVNLSGNFGITATVKGPVDHPEELQKMLAAILREMKGDETV